ncbi:MAG TPA: hypothetical protein VF614_08420, partial [Chthoniobacteraceae bacterium]
MNRSLSLLAAAVAMALLRTSAAGQRGDNPDARPLSAQEQLARFKVPPGFEVQLVAAEPAIQKPINLNFDGAGRLWVTGSEMYPWPASTDAAGQPLTNFDKVYEEIANAFGSRGKAPPVTTEGKDTIRVLSEFGPDGSARKIDVFADGLNIPTGIVPLARAPGAKGNSVIAYSIPSIWRLDDTDGDGKADKREALYSGFDFLDTHGMSSNYIQWLDGWIYGCHGFRNKSEIKDRSGNVLSMQSGNTYRFKPDGSKFEYWSHGQTNPFGLAFDPRGNLFSADSHSKPVYLLLRGGFYEGIGKEHDGLGFAPRITDDDHGSSGIAGVMYYADDKWPKEFYGNLFNGNPVTQRVNRATVEWRGSTPKTTRVADFLTCDDPWFRPVQTKLGPDGALYIADFYNPIIGHYEVPLNDPRRDRKHGRIWRVVWKGLDAPAGAAKPIETASPDLTRSDTAGLIAQLAAPNIEVRRLAVNELVSRMEVQAIDSPIFKATGEVFKTGSVDQQIGAMWAFARHEQTGTTAAVNLELATQALQKADPLLKAHFVRVLATSKKLAADTAAQLTSAIRSGAGDDAHLQRALADFIAQHPTEEGIAVLAQSAESAQNAADSELSYARKVALREILNSAEGFTWAAKVEGKRAQESIADVSLAVAKPASAEFLLAYLEQRNFTGGRANDYLKHIALHLPEDQLPKLVERVQGAGSVAPAQQLALADGLNSAARKRALKLPESITTWMQKVMIESLASSDEGVLKQAIAAVREMKVEAKREPLAAILGNAQRSEGLRTASMEALANLPDSSELLVVALADTNVVVRKRAAELLGQQNNPEVTAKMIAALNTAPWEFATTIAGALAKSDAGAGPLLAAVEAGKASAALLRHQSVSSALGSRPQAMKDHAAALTKDLPPEDTRLD